MGRGPIVESPISMKVTAHTPKRGISLKKVARVQPGYLSRRRIRPASNGSHRLVQAKDVSENDGVRLEKAVRFHPERKPGLYHVSRGDVLFTARGRNHRAYHVDQDLSNTLAAATFYILRPDTDRILPGYLAWWLNLPQVQAVIDTVSGGTHISYISRQALENLRIRVPALTVQRRIERVLSLWRERNSVRSLIDEKRQEYIRAVCQQAIRRA